MISYKELIFKQFEVGFMQNFVYFIGDANTKSIAVIDLSGDIEFILDEVKKENYKIKAILLTHGHYDHINGLEEIISEHNVPIYISKHEFPIHNTMGKNIIKIEDGETIKIDNIKIECIHTPGHSPGCTCYKYKNILLTGDTLFVDGCGRCDLQGGDPKTMYETLYNKILKLPADTVIFPGHNYSSKTYDTLASQKKTNPYLQSNSLDDFLYRRMGY